MLTHDALDTYVADRQQVRTRDAEAHRTGRLLRAAREARTAARRPQVATPVPTPIITPAPTFLVATPGATNVPVLQDTAA